MSSLHLRLAALLSGNATLPVVATAVVAVMALMPVDAAAQLSSPFGVTPDSETSHAFAFEIDSFADASPGGDVAAGSLSPASVGTDAFLEEFCGDAELPRDLAGTKARERRHLPIDCARYIYRYGQDDNGVSITACRLTKQWTRTLNFGIVSISSVRCHYSGCGVHNIGAAESQFYLF